MLNRTCPETDPCGTPNFIKISTDSYPSTRTFWHLSHRKLQNQLNLPMKNKFNIGLSFFNFQVCGV